MKFSQLEFIDAVLGKPHPQIYFFSLKGNGILSLGFLGFCSSLSVVDTVCCFLVSSIKSEVILICLPLFVMYSCCLKGGPVSSGSLELGDFFVSTRTCLGVCLWP